MSGNLYYNPGQTVAFYQAVTNGHQLTDSPTMPAIVKILGPDFAIFQASAQSVTHVSVGLYYFKFVFLRTALLGTYFVDIAYTDPNTHLLVNDSRQIIVSAPVGNIRTLG